MLLAARMDSGLQSAIEGDLVAVQTPEWDNLQV